VTAETDARGWQPNPGFPPQLFQRLLIREIGAATGLNLAGGSDARYELEKTGFVVGLLVRMDAEYDIAVGGSAVGPRSGYAAVARFTLQPPGPQPIIRAGGWSMHLHNLLRNDLSTLAKGGAGQTSQLFDAPGIVRNNLVDLIWPNVANVADQLGRLWWWLPLTRSYYDLRGILPMGNQTTTVLYVTPGAKADVWVTPANVSNDTYTVRVFQFMLTTPPVRGDVQLPDLSWVLSYEDADQPVVATGDNPVIIDPRDTILRVAHTFINNALLSSAVIDSVTLRFDQTFVHQATDRRVQDYLQQQRATNALPLGVIAYDFDHLVDTDGSAPITQRGEGGIPYALSVAPWVHTEGIATIRSIATIAAGTVLTNARLFTTICRLARVVG
jgi:hypothetical protein